MIAREEHQSPDGQLRFIVLREPGDTTLGFEGYSWHTHGDVIAGELKLVGKGDFTAKEATERLISDLLSSRVKIAILRINGMIADVYASYLEEGNDSYRPDEESLELRYWDGTPG